MNRTERGEQRIITVTDTAADMFLEMGYDAVSVDSIISQAGGSRRNIYEHFGGKEGLFIEAISRLCVDILAPLRDITMNDDNPHAALTAFGQNLLGMVLQPRSLSLHRLMISEGARFSQVARAIWKSGPENAGHILNLWVVREQANGRIRGDLPSADLAAQFINALVAGPQLQALAGIISVPLDLAEISRLTEISVANFLNGCLVKENTENA